MDETTGTTSTQAPPPPGSGPRVTRDEVKDLGRLRRSVTDRHIAGVAGGLARHLDVDPIIVRVVLVVAAFFGGAGLVAYVGAWVLVPEEGTDDEPLGLDQRNRSIALAAVGAFAVLSAVGDWAGAYWFPWPLAIVAALAVWFLHRQRSGERADPTDPVDGTDHRHGSVPGPVAYQGWDASYARPARTPRTPRSPRRRGPVLFFFTVALIALAEGLLGVVDLAGADVVDSAYPALALAITTLMLLVGSVWGRAGGLVLLGLVAALATGAASVGEDVRDTRVEHAPTSASDVRDSYDFGGGTFTLDLSGVRDVDALDGREIDVTGVGGRVEVVVPDGMDVAVSTSVVGGDSRVFDQRSDGFDVTRDGFLDGGDDVPDLSLTIDLVGGAIVVREAA